VSIEEPDSSSACEMPVPAIVEAVRDQNSAANMSQISTPQVAS
jgi:hypothetical protein